MQKFKVYFDNGHTEEVEANDGGTAKMRAREKAGLYKDERAANGNIDRVSKVTRVETIQS